MDVKWCFESFFRMERGSDQPLLGRIFKGSSVPEEVYPMLCRELKPAVPPG